MKEDILQLNVKENIGNYGFSKYFSIACRSFVTWAKLKTFDDLLRFTGGNLSVIERVGEKEAALAREEFKRLGVDVDSYSNGHILNSSIPNYIARYFHRYGIWYMEDLKKITAEQYYEIMRYKRHDIKYLVRVINHLQNLGIKCSMVDDNILLAKELPPRVKKMLIRYEIYSFQSFMELKLAEIAVMLELEELEIQDFRRMVNFANMCHLERLARL